MKKAENKRGFTLIELLVVVLIIGILAAVAVPQYQKAVMKSRLVQMMIWINTLKKGTTLYYLTNNRYPTDLSKIDIELGAKEYKPSIAISPGTPAAFFDENTECLVNSSYVSCMSQDFYILRHHQSPHSVCYGHSVMAVSVCKSFSDGISIGQHQFSSPPFKSNGYAISNL